MSNNTSASKKNKARTWEDIDENTQEKLIELRQKENELLEKSGYRKWRKYFLTGYGLYALTYFLVLYMDVGT
jgi:hypothetical protein